MRQGLSLLLRSRVQAREVGALVTSAFSLCRDLVPFPITNSSELDDNNDATAVRRPRTAAPSGAAPSEVRPFFGRATGQRSDADDQRSPEATPMI